MAVECPILGGVCNRDACAPGNPACVEKKEHIVKQYAAELDGREEDITSAWQAGGDTQEERLAQALSDAAQELGFSEDEEELLGAAVHDAFLGPGSFYTPDLDI